MIFAIKPFEIHDGDGIRTTVFFKGCPLRCKWCHNPESISFSKELLFDSTLCQNCLQCVGICTANREKDGRHLFLQQDCNACGDCESICPHKAFATAGLAMTAEEIAEEALRDEVFMKGSGGGVTFSGGEPLVQVELCVAIAKLLKQRGIHLAIDTCGFVPRAALDSIISYTNTFLFDIKAIDPAVHKACTGVSNEQILQNIQYVDRLGIPIEIRYPYVPTMNDREALAIADFVKRLKSVVRLRILPYHNYAERKYDRMGLPYPLPDVPTPSKEEIARVAEAMRDRGLQTVCID